jgi:hypothetical protein
MRKRSTTVPSEVLQLSKDRAMLPYIKPLHPVGINTGLRNHVTQLRKGQGENAHPVEHKADLAAFHNSAPDTQSQKDREDFQPGKEGVNLAASKPEPGQVQARGPCQNEMPTASTRPLDPSVQSVRP